MFWTDFVCKLYANNEKSTYIIWRKCLIFSAPPLGLEPRTLWLTVVNIFSIPFLWRYRKHWDSGITRDSKRVFGIFRTKNSGHYKALPGINSLNLIWFIYSIYIRPILQNVYKEKKAWDFVSGFFYARTWACTKVQGIKKTTSAVRSKVSFSLFSTHFRSANPYEVRLAILLLNT